MTKSFRLKNLKCVEWIVSASSGASFVSESFLLQDCKCHLECSIESHTGLGYYNSSLYFKSNVGQRLPCKMPVTVRVAKDSETLNVMARYISCADIRQEIWSHGSEGIQLKSCVLTFEVIFHFESLKNKGVQTVSYMMNGNIHTDSLSKDLSKLLDTGLNHDIQVKCENHSVKAHKSIFSARTEVFKAMLESDMQEGRTGVIEIKDIDPRYFQDFVRYLYTDEISEFTFDKAKALYEAGDKYAVRCLMHRCSEYLQDNLSPENFFECFVLADAHSDKVIKDRIVSYILDKKLYLQGKYWKTFCENFPEDAIEVYRLSYEKN